MAGSRSIGPGKHRILAGESVPSVAVLSGHFWETIWEDPNNEQLAKDRKDPTILRPGDALYVPPLRDKEVPAATGRRHRYRRKGVPSHLRVQIFDENKPRANLPFRLELVDGHEIKGTTDDDGIVNVRIDAASRSALLWLADDEEPYELRIGYLRPITDVEGVQQRLNNLGFPCGQVDGVAGPRTRRAVELFQVRWKLQPTGEIDDATRDKLAEIHDRVGAPVPQE